MLTFGHRDEHLESVVLASLRRYHAQKACGHELASRSDAYCSSCGKQLRLTPAQVRELEGWVRRIILRDYELPPKRFRRGLTRWDRRLLKELRVSF
jgi:hypothetical protein